MPYILPRPISSSDRMAFVLAFGRLSILEACSRLGKNVSEVETPCERVGVFRIQPTGVPLIPHLVGIHKAAPLMAVTEAGQLQLGKMVEAITEQVDSVDTLSLSSYGIGEDTYEFMVRSLLDEFRGAGFRKTHLIRPRGNELRADQVLSRNALDIIVFPYHRGYGLGATAWVPDSAAMRERGVQKPAPHSEISMSPRLASLLLNLASLSAGQVVLDPFCGSGTILTEALLRSCRCLGLDTSKSRIRDARRNLAWASRHSREAKYDLRVGDARELVRILGGSKVDAVVTEPLLIPSLEATPKTETAAALLGGAGDVYAEALASMTEVLSPGGRIVIVVPVVRTMEGKEASITLDGRPLGLRQYQPGPVGFEYPVRPSFESTRWVRRAVYVFELRP